MEFLRFLETLRTPLLDGAFQFFTLFGEETLFLVAALILYWCVDKRCGYYLLYICLFGTVINQILKITFCVPRPWVLDPSFTIVESARAAATGYSFPSGHTQCAAGLFLGIARYVTNKRVRIACVAMTLLVGLSRMYLGVHTPADVLVSLGVATLLVLAARPGFCRAERDGRWYIGLFGALLLASMGLVVYARLRLNGGATEVKNLEDALKTAWSMLGAGIGLTLVLRLDNRKLHIVTEGPWWEQLVKAAVGLGLVLAVRVLLKQPLLALCGGRAAANGIRYLSITLVAGALWPLAFRLLPSARKRATAHRD